MSKRMTSPVTSSARIGRRRRISTRIFRSVFRSRSTPHTVLMRTVFLAASSPAYAAVKTIVLVHGAFADGSGWKPVADILQSHGYAVLVVQSPETSFAADAGATRRVLDKAGPCVLVGHSYGGMIITEAGMHPDVKSLVYVAAVQPDVGESLSDLADKMPPANKSIGPVGDGFLAVNPEAFPT